MGFGKGGKVSLIAGPFDSSLEKLRDMESKERAWMKSLLPKEKDHLDRIECKHNARRAEQVHRIMVKLGAKRWVLIA